MFPFAPLGDSVVVAGSTTSGSVALGVRSESVRVHNGTAALAFVAFGVGAATAAVNGNNSIPIPAGATEVFGVGTSITHAAVILSTGTGDVWFTPGAGI